MKMFPDNPKLKSTITYTVTHRISNIMVIAESVQGFANSRYYTTELLVSKVGKIRLDNSPAKANIITFLNLVKIVHGEESAKIAEQ